MTLFILILQLVFGILKLIGDIAVLALPSGFGGMYGIASSFLG
jgi:hypothetical protein